MSVLVSGSLAYDYIMDFPDRFGNHIMPKNIHILNVCFPVDRLEKRFGGTAGNIAYTMKLLGAEPLLVSALGKDGEEYLARLREKRIGTNYVSLDRDGFTASAYIVADKDDNQITAYYPGIKPERNPSVLSVKEFGGKHAPALAIVSPSNRVTMKRHLRECAARGVKAMFDPGQNIGLFSGEELRAMLKQSHFLIGNDYEMKVLMKRTGWTMQETLRHVSVVVTTLGAKGSLVESAEGKVRVAPCRPKAVLDPTGAGDAYRAGFLVGFARGRDLKTCAQMGSVAAGYAIEHVGTQEHHFTKAEFRARYKKTYKKDVTI